MFLAKMKQGWDGIVGLGARARAAVAGSRWAGLGGKTAAYLAAFILLTLVGSGRLSGWLAPPARLSLAIPTAAAAAPPGAGSASAAPAAPPTTRDAGAADAAAAEAADDADGGAATPGVAADGKVILNLATEEDLRRLPGIGATRARAILTLRARLKRFARVEDLLKVKGLGRRAVARLRPLVRVD